MRKRTPLNPSYLFTRLGKRNNGEDITLTICPPPRTHSLSVSSAQAEPEPISCRIDQVTENYWTATNADKLPCNSINREDVCRRRYGETRGSIRAEAFVSLLLLLVVGNWYRGGRW